MLWLTSILDGALARRGRFLQRLGREKLRLAFRVSADAQWVSGGVFLGVNAKKSHVLRLDEGAPVTNQSYVLQPRSTVFPIGRDAPP